MDSRKQPITETSIREALSSKLTRYFGCEPSEATAEQMYKATIMTVKDILTEKRQTFHEKAKKQHPKKVYYLCMEFLIGPSLKNNLRNLGLADEYRAVLADMGFALDDI